MPFGGQNSPFVSIIPLIGSCKSQNILSKYQIIKVLPTFPILSKHGKEDLVKFGQIKYSAMKKLFLTCFILSHAMIMAQSAKDNWNFNLNWAVPATGTDSIASLQLELNNVWNHDSIKSLWLSVSDLSGDTLYDSTLAVSGTCFNAQGDSCLIPVTSIKSGFYQYSAKIIYKDDSETLEMNIDQTTQLRN